jgi:hypothetical protein
LQEEVFDGVASKSPANFLIFKMDLKPLIILICLFVISFIVIYTIQTQILSDITECNIIYGEGNWIKNPTCIERTCSAFYPCPKCEYCLEIKEYTLE